MCCTVCIDSVLEFIIIFLKRDQRHASLYIWGLCPGYSRPLARRSVCDEQASMSRKNLRTQLEELRREKEQLETDNARLEAARKNEADLTAEVERLQEENERETRGHGGRRTRSRRDGALTRRTASDVRGYPS